MANGRIFSGGGNPREKTASITAPDADSGRRTECPRVLVASLDGESKEEEDAKRVALSPVRDSGLTVTLGVDNPR